MPANIVIDTSAILAVLLDEPEKQAVIEATMGSIVCAPASLRWQVGNAATAGVKRRRLTRQRLAEVLEESSREREVQIRRQDGRVYVVTPSRSRHSRHSPMSPGGPSEV
jgi:predicted nucleic acid-binding protein